MPIPRIAAVVVALALTGSPLIARADLWINLHHMNVSSYGPSQCHREGNVLNCVWKGELTLFSTDKSHPANCVFSYWARSGGHWGTNFTSNKGCKATWKTGSPNTLTIEPEIVAKPEKCGKMC